MGQFTSPGGTELIAPAGQYRVVGVDTFDHPVTDWVQGDFATADEALAVAAAEGATMTMMHVYDDDGNHLFKAGTVT